MTTYVDFAPPPRAPFLFRATLDGSAYQAQCRWNIFGQRWYLHLYTVQQALVCCVPIVGSPDPLPLAGLAWDGTRQRVVATTAAPHGFRLGSVADLTLSGALPSPFDGRFRFSVLSPTTLAYAQATDPGDVTLLGAVGRDVDLTAGYFTSSTLVFRESSGQFEISP